MENILIMRDIEKKFGKKPVLNGINCSLNEGIYGLLGPNGSGKTTLFRCIAGLYSYKGIVRLGDKDMQSRKNNGNVGYLPQEFALFRHLSVLDMMYYFANLKEIKRKEAKARIEECLEKVNMEEHRTKKISALSGGMKRRLGMAQALLGNPRVLLLDEPTSGLDPEERMRMKGVISTLGRERIVIVSTHIVEDVEACCDEIIIMKQGNICTIGDAGKIAAYAAGKVYEREKKEQEQDGEDTYIEREYVKEGKIICRVLSKRDDLGTALNPDIEDGYICILKGI